MTPMNSSTALGPIAAFALVLLLIPAALWLLKRSRRFPGGLASGWAGRAAGDGPVRLVSTLALSPQQQLVTVEVGAGDERCWLVLGVTPAGIQTLHRLPPQPDPPAAEVAPLFAQLLGRQLRGGKAAAGPVDAR